MGQQNTSLPHKGYFSDGDVEWMAAKQLQWPLLLTWFNFILSMDK